MSDEISKQVFDGIDWQTAVSTESRYYRSAELFAKIAEEHTIILLATLNNQAVYCEYMRDFETAAKLYERALTVAEGLPQANFIRQNIDVFNSVRRGDSHDNNPSLMSRLYT